MNYISLFTGIGGFDIALDRQGFNCVMQVEKDEQATNVLRRHWSPVPKHDDVTTFSKDMISEPVDIICGGFPCFVAGTLILTQSGYVPIEDVTIGDLVLTHNLRFKKVIQVMKRESNETVCLSGVGGKITTTSEHPFFSVVSKRNWSAGSNGKNTFSTPLWIKAQDMVGRYWLSPCIFPTIDMPNFDIKEREKIPCNFTEDFFLVFGFMVR